jgi:hypothetical protein
MVGGFIDNLWLWREDRIKGEIVQGFERIQDSKKAKNHVVEVIYGCGDNLEL